MKVLLIQPPIEDFFTTPIRLYPLGLLYTAAALQKLGCDVEILDCLNPPKKRQVPIPPDFSYLEKPFADSPWLFKGYYRFGISDKEIVARVHKTQPDYIGISSQFTAYFSSVEKLVTVLKKNFTTPIFIGGNHASAFPQEIMERVKAIDHVLVGPAELRLPTFLKEITGKTVQPHSINWKYLQPSHELLRASDYRMGKRNYISLTASRGCPYKCEFCSVHNMFGRRIEYRDIDDLVDEMHQNYIHKKVRIFNFEDDNFSFNRHWFRAFLQRIISDSRLQDIELTALNGICYPTLDDELLELMFKAGFRQLPLSFVTQDEALRHHLKRPAPDSNLERIVKKAHELGFFITVYIIIGLPMQTFAEVKQSIDYLLGLNVLVGPSVFYIPPASELYDKLDTPALANWNMYRSSAFAVETEHLDRSQLLELFSYTREQNLKRKTGGTR